MYLLRQYAGDNTRESGFVLVLSLVILLMLTLFGAWVLQTSTFELKVAGGEQQIERQFNLAEGAANTEASKVGFSTQAWYKVTFDPSTSHNIVMYPTSGSDFDPGGDAASIGVPDPTNFSTWPWENLLWPSNTRTQATYNSMDYRYLVTYLYSDAPPMGYDPSSFSGYRFRIQGNAARASTLIELGGIKVGVKTTL